MPFTNFTSPYQNPANVPEVYRKHPNLSKLFKTDGTYVRPAEDPVTIWAIALLHQEYCVPLDALELELNADFSEGTHQGGRRYQGRAEKLEEAEQSYQKIINYVFEELGINLTAIQRKRNALVPISLLQGGHFDFEAVVTLQDISSQFTEHETTLLKEIVQQTNEPITPSIDSPGEIVNYIGLANIQSNSGELVNFEPVRGEEILSASPKFKKGDILFGRMRPYLNKVWIAEFDGICSGEALVFRPNKDKVDTQFLQALLLSQLTLDRVVPLQSGSSLPRVSSSDVLNIKLPIPKDLQKQKEIGSEVEKRRSEAKRLRSQAEAVVAAAKARVERMILGEETVE